MNKIKLTVKGFKCFWNESFELGDLTILTGANASGKSTLIQALLLSRLATESRSCIVNGRQCAEVDFNDSKYSLELGGMEEIYNESHTGAMLLRLGNADFSVRLDDTFDDGKKAMFEIPDVAFNTLVSTFFYLNAEREGPRYLSPNKMVDGEGCGCHGQYTATVIAKNDGTEIPVKRWRNPKDAGKLRTQLDNWMDYIFPGITVRSVTSGEDHYKIMPRANWIGKDYAAPNIGFGISYALPILVNGLLIPEGGWLVVENPEAHLHAKAQSNIGFFLGQVAASGVRVVVETHSEHVVNGVRRAVLSLEDLACDDVNIYFLEQDTHGVSKNLIKIDESGDLSDFPVDFFDQARQDLYELVNLLRGKK